MILQMKVRHVVQNARMPTLTWASACQVQPVLVWRLSSAHYLQTLYLVVVVVVVGWKAAILNEFVSGACQVQPVTVQAKL